MESYREGRLRFIEFLEERGFKCDEDITTTREKTINSNLPIIVDCENEAYRCMGNITCAAAAVTSKTLISVDDFYKFY